jgi:hypothetical protein
MKAGELPVSKSDWRNIAIALIDRNLTGNHSPVEFPTPSIPILELRSNFPHYFLDFTLRYL